MKKKKTDPIVSRWGLFYSTNLCYASGLFILFSWVRLSLDFTWHRMLFQDFPFSIFTSLTGLSQRAPPQSVTCLRTPASGSASREPDLYTHDLSHICSLSHTCMYTLYTYTYMYTCNYYLYNIKLKPLKVKKDLTKFVWCINIRTIMWDLLFFF